MLGRTSPGIFETLHFLCGFEKTLEIKDEVRRRIDDLAPGGGFIFSPTHNIQPDVPYDNFAAMIDAYRQYAQ